MQLARRLKRKPRELADLLVGFFNLGIVGKDPYIEKMEIAGAGFINVRLKQASKTQIVREILQSGASFGRVKAAKPEKVQVEFVSANPTGPLHVGHGRQAALGDALAALLESQGHAVTREFYYNDAGAQIENLARSVQARAKGIEPGGAGWPADGYAGEYIADIAKEIADADDLDAIRKHAVAYLRKEQDADLQAFGVKFDVYYLESSLYTDGKVEPRSRAWSPAARPTRRTARCGCAPPTTATTRTAWCASPTAATPTSCPTSPITSPSGSAASPR